jgi:hypothetical protein
MLENITVPGRRFLAFVMVMVQEHVTRISLSELLGEICVLRVDRAILRALCNRRSQRHRAYMTRICAASMTVVQVLFAA